MRVELFENRDVSELKRDINNWFGEHPNMRIDRILQSVIPPGATYMETVVISIWYEEEP